ncbi:Phosphohydrolase (MutT/nudix family protein) [Minicystis rosea]|nr:Phosphohydrolase (MutT/nudix family protein) [Minicystis rosea]
MRRLTTAPELEAIIGTPSPAVLMKQIDALDDGCRRVLASAPVAGFGFRDAANVPHTTFIGGQRGFAHMNSPTRIAFDLPSGHPAPKPGSGVSLVFLLPGVGETLRLNGSVAERGVGQVVVAVEEAYVHCARSILRSGLWNAARAAPATSGANAHVASNDETGPLRTTAVAGFLASSPFAVVSSWDSKGSSDTSPRGDHPGFLRILDGHTLVIPDRRGNQRTDTLHNLLMCDQISVAAVVPGRDDVLHVRGTAYATDDAALLSTMALAGKAPQLALVIRVERADVLANEAVQASNLWLASTHLDRSDAPDLMGMAAQHLARNKGRGVKATALRLLGSTLGAFPAAIRRLIDFGYRKGLADEGYEQPAAFETKASSNLGALGARVVRVAAVIRETADAVTLLLEDPSGAPFLFKTGQYFTLCVEIEGERVRRAYSASSVPGEARLALTIKRVPGGRCSSHVNESARPGDRLEIIGPSGTFCIESDASARRDLVLIAGGSGITPMMSITRTVLAKEPNSRVALLYGNRSETDIIFAASLAALRDQYGERFTLRHVLEKPPADWSGGSGLLDEATLREELMRLAPMPHARFFVCGPEPMMRGARRMLTSIGVAAERIHEERFSSPRGGARRKRVTARQLPMIVEQGGRRIGAVDVPAGKTLLEAGLDAGLPMPFSCTMGNCGECRVALVRGEVEMDDPNTLTAEERARGFILTCVARPLSPTTIEIEAAETTNAQTHRVDTANTDGGRAR